MIDYPIPVDVGRKIYDDRFKSGCTVLILGHLLIKRPIFERILQLVRKLAFAIKCWFESNCAHEKSNRYKQRNDVRVLGCVCRTAMVKYSLEATR